MRLPPETSPFPRLLVWPLLALGAFAGFWLRWKPDLVLRLAHCPLKDNSGIPCPTCGGTQAAAALARLDVAAAWWANPLVTGLAVALAVWSAWALLATFVKPWRVGLELTAREQKAARLGAAVLLLAGWWWQFLR